MGNFLAILATDASKEKADQLFQRGLESARVLKEQVPGQTTISTWSRAAWFSRQNGSGAPLAQDEESGCWLAGIGTFFHQDEPGLGKPAKLLQRYLQVGAVQLAKELDGFFCLLIGDARTQEVITITDVVGSRHAFFRVLPQGVALSGSSLLLAALGECSLDPIACQEFVHTGIIYQDRTLYKEARKLPPASVLWFGDGKLKKQQSYWSCGELAPDSLDDNTAVSRLWESLTQAAEQVSCAFPRPVCDLTGGYDSRAAVAAFLSLGRSFSTTVSGPAGTGDVAVSQALAKEMGLSHLHLEKQSQQPFEKVKRALCFTDGEYDLVEYSGILDVHGTLSQQFDISINGSFGELARGYWWELLIPHTGARRKLDAAKLARMRYAPKNPVPLFRPEIRLEPVRHFTQVVAETNAGLFSTPNTFQMDHAYLRMRMQRWQGRIASSTDQLWPCLSIFMRRPILEVMLQARSGLRKRSLLVRKMLARFQPALAEFPLEHGYPALPANWSNLHRFWPLAGYYANKVLQRAGWQSRPHVQAEDTQPPRLQLWKEEEVRELLALSSMETAGLLEGDGVRNFLQESQKANFSRDAEWQRLLSLEYALRRLRALNRI